MNKNNLIRKNASWLIGGSMFNKMVSFFISLLTARYLGPSNYGLISYAAAYTTLFFSLCTLGINSIIVKEFVDNPEKEGEIMGTTLVLQGLSSSLSIIVIFLIVFFLNYGETLTLLVVVLCSLGLFFQMMDSLKYWFQYKLMSKYAAIATTVAYVISSTYKVILLLTEKNVIWFSIATSIDYLCVALVLLFFYKKNNGPKFVFSLLKSKQLLKKSCPFIITGLMISIYGATDKLMLKNLLDEASVGYYGIAISVSTAWVFVLGAIIDSYKPVIADLFNTDRKKYEEKNAQLYSIIFYCSIFVSIFMTILAPIGIRILYGESFLPAVNPTRICTWYVAFSYLGVARDIWIVCEGKQKKLPVIYAMSALTNVLLNAILIPLYQASGAAMASLLTQISTIVIYPLFIKDYQPNVKLILKSLVFSFDCGKKKNE